VLLLLLSRRAAARHRLPSRSSPDVLLLLLAIGGARSSRPGRRAEDTAGAKRVNWAAHGARGCRGAGELASRRGDGHMAMWASSTLVWELRRHAAQSCGHSHAGEAVFCAAQPPLVPRPEPHDRRRVELQRHRVISGQRSCSTTSSSSPRRTLRMNGRRGARPVAPPRRGLALASAGETAPPRPPRCELGPALAGEELLARPPRLDLPSPVREAAAPPRAPGQETSRRPRASIEGYFDTSERNMTGSTQSTDGWTP